jgi:Stress responsive A/B Barrel Domain
MKFLPGVPGATKQSIFAMLQELRAKPLGILDMVHGPFAPSPTAPASDYTDGLVVTFASIADRNNYNGDPDHQRILNQEIIPNLEGGKTGLLRFDFVQEDAAEGSETL